MRTLNVNVLSSEHKAIIEDELEQGHWAGGMNKGYRKMPRGEKDQLQQGRVGRAAFELDLQWAGWEEG